MLVVNIILIVLLLGQTVWCYYRKIGIYRGIDQAEELLAVVMEQSGGGNIADAQWQQWKRTCEKYDNQGAIGRLYGRIWEVAQIYRERESGHGKEQAYLKDLMQDISHQLKTPLAALSVFVDIFAGQLEKKQGKEQELVEQARRQIERMRWLVTGMLKLAQIESGVLQYEYEECLLRDILERCISSLRVQWEAKGIQVHMKENAEESITLRQDPGWMQEAYQNILKNAIEYSPMNSVIDIKMEQTSLGVIVSVQDQGEGIPEQELPKIFNRFYRIHRNTQKEDGVGIGLALAKSIIEAQGGILTVYSQTGEASYTRFVATFLRKLDL